MDLTPTFRSLLPPGTAQKPLPHLSSPFFQSASTLYNSLLTLHRNMLSLRKPYLALSTSQTHISALDTEANSLLTAVSRRLQEFEKAENVRRMLEDERKRRDWKRGLRGLLRGEEEGEETIEELEEKGRREVRDAVVWCLNERLGRIGEVVRGMREERMGRAVGKLESSGFRAGEVSVGSKGMGEGMGMGRDGGGGMPSAKSYWDSKGAVEEGEVSSEMVQQLELENREMVKGFEGMMEGVRNAEKSLIEISNLQLQLAANLTQQEAHLSQLVTDSFETTENLEKGNKQLKEAAKKASFARAFFWGSLGFAGVVVVWDLIV